MSQRLFTAPRVHLHWVRETPSRGLELPVSRTLSDLAALPECVRAAILATGLETVEVHLPPYRPGPFPDLEEWCAALEFRQDAVGRLIATHPANPDPLAVMAFHHAVVLVMRAIHGDTTPLTLVAETGPSPLLPQPLAIRYRCADAGGLASAPAERSHHYNRVYKSLSVAIQRAIRDTFPANHFETVSQLEDRPHCLSLLCWSAAEPVVGRYVDQLGVDIFNTQMLNRACTGMVDRLGRRLEEVRDILLRHRVLPLYSESYHPSRAARVLRHCRKHPQFLHLLFVNEFRLICAFVLFCVRIRGWRAVGAANPGKVYREIRETWENIEILIRRFYQRRQHSAIGSILLLEAVRTLEAVD